MHESISFTTTASSSYGVSAFNSGNGTWHVTYFDGDGYDGDGSAGVREPRRPLPAPPSAAAAAELSYSG